MRNSKPALAGRYKNRALGILPQVLNEVTGVLGDKKHYLKNCNPQNPYSVVRFGGISIIPFFPHEPKTSLRNRQRATNIL